MKASTSTEKPQFSPQDQKLLTEWVFRDRESMEERFGLEMERILELFTTDKGKMELLKRMKELDPKLNGNVESAAEIVEENIEQLEKKQSFFRKMLELPGNAVEGVGKGIKSLWNHKTLVLIAIALAAWQLPNLIAAFAKIEGAEAAGALAKAGEYLHSFLPFSVGKTGSGAAVALGTPPGVL